MRTNIIARTVAGLAIRTAVRMALMGAVCTMVHAETPNAVTIRNFMFSPMDMTIKAGSTVTWKNMDGEPHTVVNDAGLFRSSALDENDTYQYKFDKPGVYKVFCGIHPNMKETITVQ